MNISVITITKKITRAQLEEIACQNYGHLIKGVVDIDKKICALGGELHADAEAALLMKDSRQEHLWGFNIYPNKPRHEWIEFTSLINIRPSQHNLSLDIKDPTIKETIRKIIDTLIE